MNNFKKFELIALLLLLAIVFVAATNGSISRNLPILAAISLHCLVDKKYFGAKNVKFVALTAIDLIAAVWLGRDVAPFMDEI